MISALTSGGISHAASSQPSKLPSFMAGGDISLLPIEEKLGTVYKLDGKPMPFFAIAKKFGWNTMRLRLWVNPSRQGIYVNDLKYTETLGHRIKAAGFTLILDIHYSDSWADPGKQGIPAQWENLDFDQLTTEVRIYTAHVIAGMISSDASPDIVQIGNEIPGGMLFPDGKDWGPGNDFKKLGVLLKAGEQGVTNGSAGHQRPKIMIHIDRGADWDGTKWFFDGIDAQHVAYDIIGESYYPAYHGPLSAVKTCLANIASTYHKPVIIVETGYPYSGIASEQIQGKGVLEYPISPDGQKQFLAALVNTVRSTPDGLARGVIYWAPEWLPASGMQGSWDSKTLFDNSGNALPAISELHGTR